MALSIVETSFQDIGLTLISSDSFGVFIMLVMLRTHRMLLLLGVFTCWGRYTSAISGVVSSTRISSHTTVPLVTWRTVAIWWAMRSPRSLTCLSPSVLLLLLLLRWRLVEVCTCVLLSNNEKKKVISKSIFKSTPSNYRALQLLCCPSVWRSALCF